MSYSHKPPVLRIPAEAAIMISQNIVWAYGDMKILVTGVCGLSWWEFSKYFITQSQLLIVHNNLHYS